MSKYIKLEDAIEAVTSLFRVSALFSSMNDNEEEWREKAEKVLDNLPTIEVSEDAISREYMLRALNGYGKDWQEDCKIAEIIRNAPRVILQPKEGEWIFVKKEQDKNQAIYRCSICGNHKYGGGRFCGMCGAKMKGADDE